MFSPDGREVAFIARFGKVTTVFVADAQGRKTPSAVQPDLTVSITSVDWK